MRGLSLLFAVPLLLGALGCHTEAKSEPTIKTDRVEMDKTDAAGLVLHLQCTVHNPNPVDVPIVGVSKARLAFLAADTTDVKASTSVNSVPANSDTPVIVDIKAPWSNVSGAVAQSSQRGDTVKFTAGAELALGGNKPVSAVVSQDGTMSKRELLLTILQYVPIPKDAIPQRSKAAGSSSSSDSSQPPAKQ